MLVVECPKLIGPLDGTAPVAVACVQVAAVTRPELSIFVPNGGPFASVIIVSPQGRVGHGVAVVAGAGLHDPAGTGNGGIVPR